MKPKHLPRLWCALQGLLPFDACVIAQRAELAWPPEPVDPEVLPSAPCVSGEGGVRLPRRRGRFVR